ncbi:hypothetical protein ACS0TY_018797 [Phlomoides rotata]
MRSFLDSAFELLSLSNFTGPQVMMQSVGNCKCNLKSSESCNIMISILMIRDSTKCASVALMFQIGENVTYHRMGGCEDGPDACTNKTCRVHEVDIMHFSLGNAIPG